MSTPRKGTVDKNISATKRLKRTSDDTIDGGGTILSPSIVTPVRKKVQRSGINANSAPESFVETITFPSTVSVNSQSFQNKAINNTQQPSLHLNKNEDATDGKKSGNKVTLAKYGLKPGKTPVTTPLPSSKTSFLRGVIINSVDGGGTIVFRCEPAFGPANGGCWSEKVFNDAIYERKQWAVDLDISPTIFHWYNNNQKALVMGKYGVRLFMLHTHPAPEPNTAMLIAEDICGFINNTDRNTTTISVDRDSFFWLEEPVTWDEVIGVEDALKMLVAQHGTPRPGFYSQHLNYLTHFFAPSSLDSNLKKRLLIPEGAFNLSEKTISETNVDDSEEE